MRYVDARYKAYQHDMAYRFYVTDALYYGISIMAFKHEPDEQLVWLSERFIDMINPKAKPQVVETRTEAEIISELCDNYGITIAN